MSSLTELSEDAAHVRDFEVREYMEQMDLGANSVFSPRLLHVDKTGQWLSASDKMNLEEVYSECANAQLNLTARINKYLEKSKQPPINLEANGSWDDVKSQMEKACAVLDSVLSKKKKRPGLTGAIRRGFDVLCRNAGAGKALISIIPSDLMIASAVSGGLNVIFVALEQHGIYEESVFNALESLPEVLNTNEMYSKIAVNDTGVHRLTARLYARVCEVIDYILRWMMDNVLVSGAKQMFRPNRYAKDLNDKMAEVRLAAEALEKWAATLLLQSQKNIHSMQGGMYFQQMKFGHQVENIDEKVDQLTSKVDRMNKLEHVVPMVFNSFHIMLNDEWHRVHQHHDLRKSIPKQLTPLKISAEDVLEQLLFDPHLVFQDMKNLLRQGTSSLNRKLQPHRLLAIQQNPRIKAWLSLDSPSLLLLNGNSTSHLDLSTSFFSAKVMDTLMQQASESHKNIEIISLAYFCGQHQNYSRDVAASPAELAMSLFLQLVNGHRDFEPNVLQRCLDKTVPYDIGSITESLSRLLNHLQTDAMVFVIIDGIEHFSRPDERKRGFCKVLSQLVRLFREQREAKVKLLFTSAQRGIVLEGLGLLMDDEIVDVPKNPPPRAVPNDQKMLMGF
ncbi:hypothetical protein N8I77_011382 [Diaporthe amygdali]|uniref:Nephrocystin 3-like N-terminal domain-containing protein n=1 Tax=Phomopsis amygdali TaxID=1214568 RepID=A0AAD9VYK8_PHOAM|nr:hypothetical protein N8I77_011382 [Diaporthe amygdali]